MSVPALKELIQTICEYRHPDWSFNAADDLTGLNVILWARNGQGRDNAGITSVFNKQKFAMLPDPQAINLLEAQLRNVFESLEHDRAEDHPPTTSALGE